ncbi:MAG: hypothetical protein ACOYMG_18515 [Candidatus Methylumidiphilus sp.]
MSTIQLQEKLHGYGQWRDELIRATDRYRLWLQAMDRGNESEADQETTRNLRDVLVNERLVVAFVAEFSRGKTELINALFFSDTGLRLLPSLPGRTTMCPTEIFHDPSQGSYIRLLPIETRLSDMTLTSTSSAHICGCKSIWTQACRCKCKRLFRNWLRSRR